MKDFKQIRENNSKQLLNLIETAMEYVEDAQYEIAKAIKLSAKIDKSVNKQLKSDIKELSGALESLEVTAREVE